MKQKTIKIEKGTLLVVEPPEEAINIYIHQDFIHYETFGLHKFRLPDGSWQLLGKLLEITEEQAEDIVDSPLIEPPFRPFGSTLTYPSSKVWCDYTKGGCWWAEITTALDSLHTLLQANEIYFENPIPPFIERLEDFKEAQSKVWDKERTFLFIKVS